MTLNAVIAFIYQVLLIYQYLSLSGYQVLLQQSQEAYQVLEFLEMFLTHDPTQPNPWIDPPMNNSDTTHTVHNTPVCNGYSP